MNSNNNPLYLNSYSFSSKFGYFDKIKSNIEQGKLGLNIGIPIGLPTLNYFLGGLRKKKYILLGSNTGVGKTAFVDYVYIIYPLFWLLKNKDTKKKLKIIYYSFEIDLDSKLIKWASLLLFLDKGIIVDPDIIISARRKKNNLNEVEIIPEEIEQQILSLKPYFDYIEENVEIIDTPMNPTGIRKKVLDHFLNNGVLEEEKIVYKDTKTNKDVERIKTTYIPYDNDLTTLLVVDHYGLLKLENVEGAGKNKKSSIDKLSEYIIELRNKYELSAILISQFNRDISDVGRHKQNKELRPQLEDFKETSTTSDDADIVLAPFNPNRYDITKYRDYDLTASFNSKILRWLFILKNRGGKADVNIALRLLGECGYFEELLSKPPITLSTSGMDDFYKDLGNFKIDIIKKYKQV